MLITNLFIHIYCSDLENSIIPVDCSTENDTIIVQWEPVLTNCDESSYSLIYTATVLWKEDPPTTETLQMGSNLSHIVKEEYYIPYTEYAFNVTTETKSGVCTITSNQASK